MKNKIILLIFLFLFCQLKSMAIEIIYPKSNGAKIYANATFFVGNSNPNNDLYLNGEKIEILPNGAFLKYVPLNMGENAFFFEEKNVENGSIISTIDFRLNRVNAPKNCINNNQLSCLEKLYIARVKQDNIPLRANSNTDATRLSHINSNTILILNGKQNDFWRVVLSDGRYVWVNEEHITEPVEIEDELTTKVDDIKFNTDNNSYSFEYKLKYPVPYIIEEVGNTLIFKMYNVDTSDYQKTVDKNFVIEPQDKNILITKITLNNNLWGYDAEYKNGYMIFKINKQPKINKSNALRDIRIVIDAGHGGREPGAIGPTGVKESVINLDVAQKLQKLLQNEGATVYMTREDDCYVDLYERIKFTKEKNPLFLISLHANALPDGGNPEIKHGTSVFYFYPQSKKFAYTLQKTMLHQMGTKDDGVGKRSLVLTRNTSCLSVLVEMAYMVHPREYTLLLDDNFRLTIAKSIKDGIEKYLLEN